MRAVTAALIAAAASGVGPVFASSISPAWCVMFRLVRSLERSLDAACREAFEKWVFKPAMRDGIPVPLQISVEMHFTLGSMRQHE
jgi:hypothetical protein